MLYHIDDTRGLSIQKIRTLEQLAYCPINPGRMAFSSNIRYGVVAGPNDAGRIGLWDIASGRAIASVETTPPGEDTRVNRSIGFAHGDAWILGGAEKGELKIWDRKSLKLLHTLMSPSGKPINGHLAVTPDSRFAITADDSAIRIWRLPHRSDSSTAVNPAAPKSPAAVHRGSLKLVRQFDGITLQSHYGKSPAYDTFALAFQPNEDGRLRLAHSMTPDGKLEIRDVASGAAVPQWDSISEPRGLYHNLRQRPLATFVASSL